MILTHMRHEEREHLGSNFGETYLKYRRVVSEWMIDVCEYFNLHLTTTHAAIAYLDRLQPNERYSRYEWQMLAICCILISAKYNECEEHVPDRATLEDITQQRIPNETILSYEMFALKRMGWKLNARTAMAFLSSYMELGLICEGDLRSCQNSLHHQIRSYASSAILDANFKSFKCSDVACAIIYISREDVDMNPWPNQLTEITQNDPINQEVQQIILSFRSLVVKPVQSTVFSRIAPRITAPSSPVHDSYREMLQVTTPVADKENRKDAHPVDSPVSITEVVAEPLSL